MEMGVVPGLRVINAVNVEPPGSLLPGASCQGLSPRHEYAGSFCCASWQIQQSFLNRPLVLERSRIPQSLRYPARSIPSVACSSPTEFPPESTCLGSPRPQLSALSGTGRRIRSLATRPNPAPPLHQEFKVKHWKLTGTPCVKLIVQPDGYWRDDRRIVMYKRECDTSPFLMMTLRVCRRH